MINEKIYWEEKIGNWIDKLAEITYYLNEINDNKRELNNELRLKLWIKFKEIIDEYHKYFNTIWKIGMIKDLYLIDKNINDTFNELLNLDERRVIK